MTRTLHNISHALRVETINHAVGPLAFPHDARNPLSCVIGVNHNIHPTTYMETIAVLQERGIQRYANSVSFCAIDADPESLLARQLLDQVLYYKNHQLRDRIRLDEVAPPPYCTLASFRAVDGQIRTVIIRPEDFLGTDRFDLESIAVVNHERDIANANRSVIEGRDEPRMSYAAMSIGLALFAQRHAHNHYAFQGDRVHADLLHACYEEAFSSLRHSALVGRTEQYVRASQKISGLAGANVAPTAPPKLVIAPPSKSFTGVNAVIFDLDMTLALPIDPAYYTQFETAVHRVIMESLGCSADDAVRIADYYRDRKGGGEQALTDPDLQAVVAELFDGRSTQVRVPLGFQKLFDEIAAIDPSSAFERQMPLVESVRALRNGRGKKIVLLSNSPRPLVERVLRTLGFAESDFDALYAWEREAEGPPKMGDPVAVFLGIARALNIPPGRVLSVGDDARYDIGPAIEAGMQVCQVRPDRVSHIQGVVAVQNVSEIVIDEESPAL